VCMPSAVGALPAQMASFNSDIRSRVAAHDSGSSENWTAMAARSLLTWLRGPRRVWQLRRVTHAADADEQCWMCFCSDEDTTRLM
jgi:hypothetical protein